MSELETLRPILESIPVDEVEEPALPMAVALQEAHDLSALLAIGEVRDRVLAVGVDPALASDLPVAITVLRQVQSQWVVVRDHTKPEAQREREAAGDALRRELVASCRWNLRHDAGAQGTLDRVVQGEGVSDLVQDLLDLAMLISHRPADFEPDTTFDAPARAEAARMLAAEISEGTSGMRIDEDQEAAKLLRDRAFTHLDRIVTDLRRAGRYAFRNEPRRRADFTSAYLRRRRRRVQRRQQDTAGDAASSTASASSAS